MNKLLFLLFVMAGTSFAQMARFDGVVLPTGTPNGPATVAVCQSGGSGGPPCSPLAVIYDQSGEPASNPFRADMNGHYTFFAPAGNYVTDTYGSGYTTTLSSVVVGAAVPPILGNFKSLNGIQFANAYAGGAGTPGSPWTSVSGTGGIQEAITALPSTGGTVYLPPGSYSLCPTADISIPDGVHIEGASRDATNLSVCNTFSGDALFKSSGRDDNNANSFQTWSLEQLRINYSSATIGVDMTGCRNCVLRHLSLNGPGPSVAGGIAIRLSDENPGSTSAKSSFFNRIEDVDAGGVGWETFLSLSEINGNANNNYFSNLNAYAKFGISFGTFSGSSNDTFNRLYLFGNSLAGSIGIVGTIPFNTRMIGVSQDLFATTTPMSDLYLGSGSALQFGAEPPLLADEQGVKGIGLGVNSNIPTALQIYGATGKYTQIKNDGANAWLLGVGSGMGLVLRSGANGVVLLGSNGNDLEIDASHNLAFFQGKGQHFNTQAANNDLGGTCTAAAATTCTVTFTAAYASAPACTATDATNIVALKVTPSTTSLVITTAASSSDVFDYHCVGNPN